MIARALLVLITGLLFVAAACGPPPEAGDQGALGDLIGDADAEAEGDEYEDMDEEDLPEWARGLEEGDPPPTETEWVDNAEVALVEAEIAGEDAPEARREALEEAVAHAEEGIENDPENPIHYYTAGQAYMMMEEWERAAEMYDEAEERHPQYRWDTEFQREQAWVELYNEGIELLQAGEEDAALEILERADRVYDKRPEAQLNLASTYHGRGELDRAAEYYGKALESIQGDRVQDFEDEMREPLMEQIEPALLNRAQINMELENYEEAAVDYEEVLERDPDNVLAQSNLSVAYMQLGDDERAREIHEALFEQADELMAQEIMMIGVGFFEGEDYEQAAEAFRVILERVPSHREAWFNLAQAYSASEEWESIVEIGDELIENNTHTRSIYQLVAQAHVHLDDEQTAVEYLDRMEELPVDLVQLQMEPIPGQGAVVVGQFINVGMNPGDPVEIQISFLGGDGSEIGSETVQVEAPAGEEDVATFQAEYATEEEVGGYSYEVISP